MSNDEELFSGKFWTGGKARELGLVDEIGDLRGVLKKRFGDKAEPRVISAPRGLFGRKSGVGVAAQFLESPSGLADEMISSLEARALWQRYGL